MSEIKISELDPATGSLDRAAKFPVTQDGETFYGTPDKLLSLGSAGVREVTADAALVDTDAGKIVEVNSSSAVVITIAALSGFPIGSMVSIIQTGAGGVTVVAGSGATVNGNLETTEQYQALFIYKSASGVYISPGGSDSSSGGGGGGLTQLATPTLTATVISDTEIDLSWTNVANESSYVLQRSPDNSTWTTINSPAANVTSYNNTGLTASTLYYYRIKAVGDGITYSDSNYGTDSDTTDAPAGPAYANFTSAELQETSSGSHIYVPVTPTGSSWNHRGADSRKIPGTTDGNVQTNVVTAYQGGGQFILGLSDSPTVLDAYASFTIGVRPIIGTGVQVFEAGAGAGIFGSVADGDFVRIRTGKAAMEAYVETSPDGTTWTTVFTSTNFKVNSGGSYVPLTDVYCHAAVYDDAGIKDTLLTNFS